MGKRSLEELSRKYDLNIEEVVKWGKENYPSFISNIYLLALIYLKQVKGIIPEDEKGTMSLTEEFKIKKLAEVKDDEFVWVKVINVGEVETFEYMYCPKCKATTKRQMTCPKCGSPAIRKVATRYLIGDDENMAYAVDTKGMKIPMGEVLLKVVKHKRIDDKLNFFLVDMRKVEKEKDTSTENKILKTKTYLKMHNNRVKKIDFLAFLKSIDFESYEKVKAILNLKEEGEDVIYEL
jgi:RNA polymerase subunit RPABC4/transcription elongation factor Spt4